MEKLLLAEQAKFKYGMFKREAAAEEEEEMEEPSSADQEDYEYGMSESEEEAEEKEEEEMKQPTLEQMNSRDKFFQGLMQEAAVEGIRTAAEGWYPSAGGGNAAPQGRDNIREQPNYPKTPAMEKKEKEKKKKKEKEKEKKKDKDKKKKKEKGKEKEKKKKKKKDKKKKKKRKGISRNG